MNRYLTIINNKIVSERFAKDILEGEILADASHDTAQVGMILLDGVWQVDPQEIVEQAKQQRISDLKQIISDKKLLDEDATTEQSELKSLMSGTHDVYLENVRNKAIDKYTKELIEGGLL